MRFLTIRNESHYQSGFTLVELLVVLSIVGILAVAAGQAISQIFLVNAGGNARMTAIKQVENSIDIMRRDMLMAQMVTPDPTAGSFLEFSWVEWGTDNKSRVIYSLVDNRLLRQIVITDKDGNRTTDITRTLAGNVESIIMDNKVGYTGGKIVVSITTRIEGLRPASESRTFIVLPRPTN